MDNWVIQELDSLDIGDIRLEKRIKLRILAERER